MVQSRKMIIAGLPALVCVAGLAVYTWLQVQRQIVKPVPILMYHNIGKVDSPWWVYPSDLEKHVAFLAAQGYTAIFPSDLAANRIWGKPLPEKPVILTFDDGYLNALTEAGPILEKHGFKGIVYLITGLVHESADKRMSYEDSDCLVWPEVKKMKKSGVFDFGGHTVHDANLAATRDPYREIRACYEDIVNNAGFKPDSFCYPHGQYRLETLGPVRLAGFTTAMTCKDDVAMTGRDCDLVELPRLHMIGGRHEYISQRIPKEEKDNEIVVSVRKPGASINLAFKLNWSDPSEEDEWLGPLVLGKDEEVLTFIINNPAKKNKPFVLEYWDAHRILRFETAEVTGSEDLESPVKE